MKINKSIIITLFLSLSFSFFSCSKIKSNDKNTNQKNTETKADNIDLDMTKMSSTMIYSQIFNMLIMPEEYINKTIKVKGFFEAYITPEDDDNSFTIIIPDATACCKQGLDFIWEGEHIYPADYPNPGSEIIITGRFMSTENEDGVTYNYLIVSNLEKV